MPVLLGCLALMFPRFVIILTVIFSDYIGMAYNTILWPLLGFFFAPMTTLFYAFAMHSNNRSVDGFYIVGMVIAVLIDLGMFGGGGKASSRHVATYRAGAVKRVKNTAK